MVTEPLKQLRARDPAVRRAAAAELARALRTSRERLHRRLLDYRRRLADLEPHIEGRRD